MVQLRLGIYDGTRQLFPLPADFLVTVLDGGTQFQKKDWNTNIISIPLAYDDFKQHDYLVNVFSRGYKVAGYSEILLKEPGPVLLDIMLVPNDPGFNFAGALWPAAHSRYPFLGPDDAPTQQTYENLLEGTPEALACLLNISAALSQIHLYGSLTPLDYLKQVRWDDDFKPRKDRFFAWCDLELRNQIKSGATNGFFDEEQKPWIKHPGATESWKENRFGEANVQFTFHGNDPRPDYKDQIMIELDIDYYKNTFNHLVLEVLPNDFGEKTDPITVYILRWIASRAYGRSGFEPLYTITS